MLRKIILSLLVSMLMTTSYTAYAFGPFENRFSMTLEYSIMSTCVGKHGSDKRQIKVCACALEKTQENGFGADYDNDEDFWEDKDEFMEKFRKNAESCT